MARFTNSVKYSGLDELNLLDKMRLKNIAESRYKEITRLFRGSPTDLSLNIKVYEKGGKGKKVSIHGKIEAATRIFAASSADWDVKKTMHDVLNKLESEVRKQFKPEMKKRGGFRDYLREKFLE